jgi:hypothetical protein
VKSSVAWAGCRFALRVLGEELFPEPRRAIMEVQLHAGQLGQVYMENLNVVGRHYYHAPPLHPGDPVSLVREPNNPHDPNAIRVVRAPVKD